MTTGDFELWRVSINDGASERILEQSEWLSMLWKCAALEGVLQAVAVEWHSWPSLHALVM